MAEYLGAAVGYMVGLVVHYLLSVRYVFEYRRMLDYRHLELMLYVLSGVVGVALSAAIVHGGTLVGMPLIVSKMGATVAAFLAVFAIRKIALFSSGSAS